MHSHLTYKFDLTGDLVLAYQAAASAPDRGHVGPASLCEGSKRVEQATAREWRTQWHHEAKHGCYCGLPAPASESSLPTECGPPFQKRAPAWDSPLASPRRSGSCASLPDLLEPPVALRASPGPVHTLPLPALQPFRSRSFRAAHSRPTVVHQARRWAATNLNRPHLSAHHPRCSACRPTGPALPYAFGSPSSCTSAGSPPDPPSLPLAFYANPSELAAAGSGLGARTEPALAAAGASAVRLDAPDALGARGARAHMCGRAVAGAAPVRPATQMRSRRLEPRTKRLPIGNARAAPSLRTRRTGGSYPLLTTRASHAASASAPLPRPATIGTTHDIPPAWPCGDVAAVEDLARDAAAAAEAQARLGGAEAGAAAASGSGEWHDVPRTLDHQQGSGSGTLSDGNLMSETSDDAVCVKQPRSVFLGPASVARLSCSSAEGPYHLPASNASDAPPQPSSDVAYVLHATSEPQAIPGRAAAAPVGEGPDRALPASASPMDRDSLDSKPLAYPLRDVVASSLLYGAQPRGPTALPRVAAADETAHSSGESVADASTRDGDSLNMAAEAVAPPAQPSGGPQLPLVGAPSVAPLATCSAPAERQTGFAPMARSSGSGGERSPRSADKSPQLVDVLRTAQAPCSQLTDALADGGQVPEADAGGAPALDAVGSAQNSLDAEWEVVGPVEQAAENGTPQGSLGSFKDSMMRRFKRMHSPQS